MVKNKDESSLSYVERALGSFSEIMSNNHKGAMDNINRLNKGELFVLHFLSRRNRTVLPSELSEALQASTARISALLGALEKKGQIKRDIDKSNRRNILVTITDDGSKRVETEIQEIRGCMAQIFTDMGEADTIEFIRLVKRFTELSQRYRSDF